MRAIFLGDEKRKAVANFWNFAFLSLAILAGTIILMGSAFFLGDANGYTRAANELKQEAKAEVPGIYQGVTEQGCRTKGLAVYKQCHAAVISTPRKPS